jgi:hypothetical protein
MQLTELPVKLRTVSVMLVVMAGGLAAMGLGGCSSPAAPIANPTTIPTITYRSAFVASQSTLIENGFRVDRKDYRFGTITSKPERSPAFLEVWKPVNTTFEESFGSSLGAWRRVVRVNIQPKSGSASASAKRTGEYNLSVRVDVQRFHDTQRRLAGSTRSYLVISTLDEVPTELKRKGIGKQTWHTFRRDEDLEQDLLAQIVSAMGLPAPEALPAPEPPAKSIPVKGKPVSGSPAKGKRDPLSDIDLIGE